MTRGRAATAAGTRAETTAETTRATSTGRQWTTRLLAVASVVAAVLTIAGLTAPRASAQGRRIASPPGTSATEILGRHDEREGYVNGKWLEIRYGRPIKRGRDLFGPPDFADALSDGADVWRAGANQSTQLVVEVPIRIGGTVVPAGTYTLFIDLAARDRWTLIVSRWPAQTVYDEKNKAALWGAYDYTPDRDVVRAAMQLETLPHAFDQLSWQFLDMSDSGGRLALVWDRTLASVPFTVAR